MIDDTTIDGTTCRYCGYPIRERHGLLLHVDRHGFPLSRGCRAASYDRDGTWDDRLRRDWRATPPRQDRPGLARERQLLAALEVIPADADGWREAGLGQIAEAMGGLALPQVMQVRDRLVKAGVIEYRIKAVYEGKRNRVGAWRIITRDGAR